MQAETQYMPYPTNIFIAPKKSPIMMHGEIPPGHKKTPKIIVSFSWLKQQLQIAYFKLDKHIKRSFKLIGIPLCFYAVVGKRETEASLRRLLQNMIGQSCDLGVERVQIWYVGDSRANTIPRTSTRGLKLIFIRNPEKTAWKWRKHWFITVPSGNE